MKKGIKYKVLMAAEEVHCRGGFQVVLEDQMMQSRSAVLGDVRTIPRSPGRASTTDCHQHIPGVAPGDLPWVGSESWVVSPWSVLPHPGGRESFPQSHPLQEKSFPVLEHSV